MEKISVIIPTYNRGKLIKKSVMSVLNQTYKNIEVIVVDDGSTDNTDKVMSTIKDSRLNYVKMKKNGGACRARNHGIQIATGDYIAFHDSDDVYLEDKLEKQLKNLKANKSDLDFCGMRVSIEGTINEFPIIDKKIQKGNWVLDRLCEGNIIGTPAILAKKEIFKDLSFDEKLPRLQDYDFVMRVASKYKISYTEEFLIDVEKCADSISSSDEKLKKACLLMVEKDYGLNKKQKDTLDKSLMDLYTWQDIVESNAKYNALEKEYQNVLERNKVVEEELNNIVNSKRWKMLCKILKIFGK